MRTQTRSPMRCASPSPHYANASANPRSSSPSPASDIASTLNQTQGPMEGTVDRAAGLRLPRLSFARLTPRRILHLPSQTVRLRLTLLYSGLFLVSGVALLAATYLIFRGSSGVDLIISAGAPHGSSSPGAVHGGLSNPEVARQVRQMYAASVERNTHRLHQGLIQSGVALAIMTVVSI